MESSSGKVAVVTGAAGGIGAAIAHRLGQDGMSVAMLDQDAERLTEAAAKLAADGLSVTAFPADVTRTAEVDRVVESVEDRLGAVEHLVNAAGVLRMGEVT